MIRQGEERDVITENIPSSHGGPAAEGDWTSDTVTYHGASGDIPDTMVTNHGAAFSIVHIVNHQPIAACVCPHSFPRVKFGSGVIFTRVSIC